MQLLIDILNTLKKEIDPCDGICINIVHAGRKTNAAEIDIIQAKLTCLELAIQWPYHSGDVNYPIPDLTKTRSPLECYRYHDYHNSLWTGAGETLRRDLIDFCIAYLTIDDFDAKSWTNPEIEPYI